MCPCNKIETYRKELSERKAKYTSETEKNKKEAKERLAKKKGKCIYLDDIEHMSKKERIKMARYICKKEFK